MSDTVKIRRGDAELTIPASQVDAHTRHGWTVAGKAPKKDTTPVEPDPVDEDDDTSPDES